MITSAIIALLTMLNAVTVFGIQWIVVTAIGAGSATDALFAATVIPTLLANIICGSLGYVLVPALALVEEDGAAQLTWTFGVAITAVLAAVSGVLWLTANYWIPLIAPGFSADLVEHAVLLTRVQLIGSVLMGISTVLTSAYNARQQFVYPAFCAVVASAICLFAVAVGVDVSGVVVAAWAIVLRPVILTLLQLKIALPVRLPRFSAPEFTSAISRLVPLAAGSAYYKTDQLVDRMLASLAPTGTLSIFHLAQQLYGAANQLVVAAMVSPTVPRFVRMAKDDSISLWREVNKLLVLMSLISAVVFALVLYPGQEVLSLIFVHRNFTQADVHSLWMLMLALGLAWFSGLSGSVLANTFYVAGDTKTPTRIGVVGFSIGLVLKVVGFFYFGVVGIAIATGVYTFGNSAAMFVILRRRFASLALRSQ